jgi:hypothetical protein
MSWMTQDHSGGNKYGLGIFTEMRNGKVLLHHGGGGPKTYSWYISYPATSDGIVVMTNTYMSDVKGLSLSLLDIIGNATLSGPLYTPIPTTLSTPVLLSPANTDTVPQGNVLMTWDKVPFAYSDRVELSVDSLFSNPVIDTVKSNSYTAVNLTDETRYFWRVQALNLYLYDTTMSLISNPFSFYYNSLTTSLTTVKKDRLVVHPNPFQGEVTITGLQGLHPESVELYTLQGIKIIPAFSRLPSGALRIDLTFLPPGIYLLKYIAGDKAVYDKLLKQ